MSRGGTAELLKESLDFPGVQILPSSMALCRAFYFAGKIDKHIGFLAYDYQDPPYNILEISEILNIFVNSFLWKDLDSIKQEVYKAKKLGITVMVGAGGIAIPYTDIVK